MADIGFKGTKLFAVKIKKENPGVVTNSV